MWGSQIKKSRESEPEASLQHNVNKKQLVSVGVSKSRHTEILSKRLKVASLQQDVNKKSLVFVGSQDQEIQRV